MEQTIQATPATASDQARPLSAERVAFQHASAVADKLVARLEEVPRSAAVIADASSFKVRLNFGVGNQLGVLQFAEIADTDVLRDDNGTAVWMEARGTFEGVPVCAEVLLESTRHGTYKGTPAAETAPVPAGVTPVPLGASVLAQAPVIVPVPVPTASLSDQEDEAKCARCGCTENAACEGGCYWVTNAEMIELCSACATPEELAAATWKAVGPETADVQGAGE